MSKPPPTDLMEWAKADLAREVQRLRAIQHEWSSRTHDDARSGGAMHNRDGVGDPYGRGNVILDVRGAVLMEEVDVCLVDTKQDETPAAMLTLGGRVNYETRRVSQAYLFDVDGVAAIISELVGLAQRGGGNFALQFQAALEHRMAELP
jgi:hypothetical protein